MMSFGQGYNVRESLQLDEGTYFVRISKVEYVQRSSQKTGQTYTFLDVYFEVQGKPGYTPNKMSFGDRPANPDMANSWDVQMTKFFDAFGIARGNWDYNTWRGKTGNIDVVKDKKDSRFMRVYPSRDKSQSAQNTQAQQFQQPAQPAAQYCAGEKFPDQIPF